MRTVNHRYEPKHIEGARNGANAEVNKALGYLSTWAAGEYPYPYVDIYPDHDPNDLIAVYRQELAPDRRPDYVIGAIWHADTRTYSFHS